MNMSERMSVGERIRYYRLLRGMSQEALALEANINAAFVGHLERGLKSPTVTTLEKITDALNITLEELFSEELGARGKTTRKYVALEHLEYLFRTLTEQETEQITVIVQEILKYKNIG